MLWRERHLVSRSLRYMVRGRERGREVEGGRRGGRCEGKGGEVDGGSGRWERRGGDGR